MSEFGYAPDVLIGNWFNELVKHEDLVLRYLADRAGNRLKIQRSLSLYLTLARPVVLSLPFRGVQFGSTVQLKASIAQSQHSLVLSGTPHQYNVDYVTDLSVDDLVCGSTYLKPCRRNAWMLERSPIPLVPDPPETPLCYGDSFTLRLCPSEGRSEALYMMSEVGPPSCASRGSAGRPALRLGPSACANAREERAACVDLQTFTVHFPAGNFETRSQGRMGHYPLAIIPGQNTDYYKKYTSTELKYFPLNTLLYGPLRPNERHFQLPGGSDGSQSESEDSSSSDSSSSSSGDTQDTDSSSSEDEDDSTNPDSKTANSKEKPTVEKGDETSSDVTEIKMEEETRSSGGGDTPRGWRGGRGKGRAQGRGGGGRLKLAVKLKRVDSEDGRLQPERTQCKMCKEVESKNKDGVFEKFITCSACEGRIHPTCIDLTLSMVPKIESYSWQCTDCKSCVKCNRSSSEDKMIFCDHCDRGYHIFCVGLKKVPSGNYVCAICEPVVRIKEEEKIIEVIDLEKTEKMEKTGDEKKIEEVDVKMEVDETTKEIKQEALELEIQKTNEQ